ncbi:hypothetical protein L1987_56732 [Smallanthus sonchifolius]|uniref:Uncharacterized protein n=1 Tax=Smallanthus sonchifolius TaxID=185202 RepID=A0ACB9DAV2_9ASTR|nr:hypothetical protein L1987_56732 [Smallanthus sonchifolius]
MVGIWSDERFLNSVGGNFGWLVLLSFLRGGFYLALSEIKGEGDGTPCTRTTSFLRGMSFGCWCPKYRLRRGEFSGLCRGGDRQFMGGGLDSVLLLRMGWGRVGTLGTLGTTLKRVRKVCKRPSMSFNCYQSWAGKDIWGLWLGKIWFWHVWHFWRGKKWNQKTRVSRKGFSYIPSTPWHKWGSEDTKFIMEGIKLSLNTSWNYLREHAKNNVTMESGTTLHDNGEHTGTDQRWWILHNKTRPGSQCFSIQNSLQMGGNNLQNKGYWVWQSPTMHGGLIVDAGSDVHLRENENVIMNIAPIDPNREDESTGRDANQIMKDSEVTGNHERQEMNAVSPDIGAVAAQAEKQYVPSEKGFTCTYSHSNSASPGAISQIEDDVAWDRLNG